MSKTVPPFRLVLFYHFILATPLGCYIAASLRELSIRISYFICYSPFKKKIIYPSVIFLKDFPSISSSSPFSTSFQSSLVIYCFSNSSPLFRYPHPVLLSISPPRQEVELKLPISNHVFLILYISSFRIINNC